VKNLAANNIFKLLELVMYWDSCKRVASYIEEFRGSEAIEGFCCKFIYGDCRV